MAELGELLRAWRDRALMTQEQLAEVTGMSERTIRRLESGAMRQPRSSSLKLLADALGLDAGERAAITEALRAGGPSVPAPRRPVASPAQLPLDVYGFAGRQPELKLLDQGLASSAVVAITGTAGVGKTALAVHWAHRQAARFGDGQLYVNLRGAAAQLPMRPVEVLAQFLRALGVANDQIPAEEAEAAALYRSVLANRRVLIVLDNAEAAEHVRPLVPGSAGSLVLVTSRHNLEGLVASHGALSVRLSVLTPAESSSLVTSVLGRTRARAEASTVAQLADLCGHLPLALRIAAARLAYEPSQSITQYVDLLRVGDRLTALQVDGDPAMAVRATFDLSYRALPGPAATMFRLLGLVPGHDITVDAAAALAGIDPGKTVQALQQLSDHNLVGQLGPGRYSLHDLLRVYAAEKTTEADNDALHRLLEHYLGLADQAAQVVYPHMVRLAQPRQPTTTFSTYEAAQSWLVTEQANLVAAIIQGAEAKLGRAVWLLADAMRGHLLAQRNTAQWLACASSALAAATAAGDPGGIAAAQLSLGAAHYQRGEHESALISFEASLVNSHQAAWDDGELAAAMNTGLVHRAMGRLDRAIDSYQHVAELAGQGRRWLSHAAALSRLGSMFRERGQLASAQGTSPTPSRCAKSTGFSPSRCSPRTSTGSGSSCTTSDSTTMPSPTSHARWQK